MGLAVPMSAPDVAVSGCDSGGLLKVLPDDMPPRLVGFAYTAPATPFGLNAEPRAVAAFPGVTIVTSHDWFGCPFVPRECGPPANAVLPSTQHKAPPASVVISIGFITNMIRSHLGCRPQEK